LENSKFGFLRRKKSARPSASAESKVRYAPNIKIRYDRSLIAGLKNDHKKLLEICQRIDIAFGNNDVVAIRKLLRIFKKRAHWATA
jgi:hypothetical protein